MIFRRATVGLVVCAFAAQHTYAQAPRGSERLADGAVAESLTVLRNLRETVLSNYKDAAAWYHQGMIAWALYERCRHQPPAKGLDCTRPRLLADTSFMIATEIDTANTLYALALGRYLLSSEGNFHRDSPYLDRLFHTSLAKVRATGDTIAYANALLNTATLYWNRYDETAHRVSETTLSGDVYARARRLMVDSVKLGAKADSERVASPAPVTREAVKQARKLMDAELWDAADGYMGEADYLRSEYLRREALAVAPADLRAYRQLALQLADRTRWPELAAVARARIDAVRRDGWAWMTLGMSAYRNGNFRSAHVAFDSALVFLDTADLHRLDRIERVLDGPERTRYETLNSAGKVAFNDLYWIANDPLWSHEGDEPRTEFLARVAFAELVWTSEDLSLHGVDSDRGRVYIRAGPPDHIYSDRGHIGSTDPPLPLRSHTRSSLGDPFEPELRMCGNYAKRQTVMFGYIDWSYDYTRCKYMFDRFPSYETSTFSDDTLIRYANNQTSWDNLVLGQIDSMPSQLARFRAAPDSVDVYFATLPPIAAIRRAAQVVGPVRTDYWLKTTGAKSVARDSLVPAAPGIQAHTNRVVAGTYLFRAEATADGSLLAGRSSGAFIAGNDPHTGFSLAGFGVSDLLLATHAAPRASPMRRWTDLDFTPLLGAPERKSSVTLAWEAYDLQNTDGSARYSVFISMRQARATPPGLGPRMVARIANTIAGVARIDRKETPDRVDFRYDRAVPHSSTLVDYVTLALGDTPPGSYVLSLQITDRATGKMVERAQPLVIVAPARR